MRPDLLDRLNALWAQHLHCAPATLYNENTNIIAEPAQNGVEVWLFNKTCVMLAAPPLAPALKASIGTRNPIVAFEPGRLRAAIAAFGLEVFGSEAVLVKADCDATTANLAWLSPSESLPDLQAAVGAIHTTRIPALAIAHKLRAARRVAEEAGFELYASVIYIGHQPPHPNL